MLTPNAVLEPVRLAGTTVSRATLHNYDYITDRDILIGDTVIVQKAGDIIPEIVGPVKSERTGSEYKFVFPRKCPSCGEEVTRDDEAAYRCTNTSACYAQLIRNLEHFVSRDAMGIDGLGGQTIKLLRDNGKIKNIADLYKLKVSDVENLERMGKKSAENLINAIENSKSAGMEKLLYAFGIRQIGEKAASQISGKFKNIEALFDATVDDLCLVDDIGEISARNVVEFFSHEDTRKMVNELIELGVETESKNVVKSTKFDGYTFVLTGTLPTLTRDEASKIIEENGGKVSSSVSKKTTVVLAGEEAGSKLKKARDLGIRIIDEQEFWEMVK